MENDPNNKESKGKRILKKAIRRNSKANNSSQHSAIEQGINESRSKSLENNFISVETDHSAPLTTSDVTKEKIDSYGGTAKSIKPGDKTQQERSPPVKSGHSGKSRLYKDDEIKNESLEVETLPIKKEVKLNSPTITSNERSELDSKKKNLKRKLEDDSGAGTSGASTGTSDNDADDKDPSKDKKKKNRCAVCRKKVGLTGFECRCGGLFCAVHRYSDKHDCSFDYRELGAQEIRRNNPVVVSQKIHKI